MRILFAIFLIGVGNVVASAKEWPHITYKHVVAYCYDYSKDTRGASISFPDGSLHKGIIKATTLRLSEEQTKSLIRILNQDVEYERGEIDCYDPHHAFVFYDDKWKIVASIDICFLCENYVARPKGGSSLIDLGAMAAFCRQIGLPWYENSSGYMILYQQEQATDVINRPERKKRIEPNSDPFAPRD
jgi:hypothetical protein